MGLQEVNVTRNQQFFAVLFFVLMATAGAVWQVGPYGLYGGALAGLLFLSFIDVDRPGKKKGGGTDG